MEISLCGKVLQTRVWSLGFRVSTYRPLNRSFCGLYLESYKVIPKSNYYGAYG